MNFCRWLFFSFIVSLPLHALELVIGEEKVDPGFVFIFEGAIKDDITPRSEHLPLKDTHVHLELRADWSGDTDFGKGFIPYLHANAVITNERSGAKTHVELRPHINMIDWFHYARNIALPGSIRDNYSVTFFIDPPREGELSFHKDWRESFSDKLFEKQVFHYKNINFEEIAKANRS